MVTFQNYVRAASLEEAYQLNRKRRNRIVGGMMWQRLSRASLQTAIDLTDLGLDTIEETPEEFVIGAMVTLRQLEQHPGLNAYTGGACADAVKDIVGVQFRNMATAGGSVWGRFGFSDVLTLLLGLDTYVELYPTGIMPLTEFISLKKNDDILVNIRIRKTPAHSCDAAGSPALIAYQAVRVQHTDLPVLTCAVSCLNDTCRIVIGARPGRAERLLEAENIRIEDLTPARQKQLGEQAAAEVVTSDNLRGTGAYRKHLTKVLTMRGLKKITEGGEA